MSPSPVAVVGCRDGGARRPAIVHQSGELPLGGVAPPSLCSGRLRALRGPLSPASAVGPKCGRLRARGTTPSASQHPQVPDRDAHAEQFPYHRTVLDRTPRCISDDVAHLRLSGVPEWPTPTAFVNTAAMS
jgi:hypothetical protein